MAVELLGGAALGAVSAQSLKALLDFKNRAINFDEYLERLDGSVKLMRQSVSDIEEFDGESNLRNEHTKMITDELEDTHKLILKCHKTHRWNCFEKASKSKKLKRIERRLKVFPTFVLLPAQMRLIRMIKAKLEKMTGAGPVSDPKEFVVPFGALVIPDSSVVVVGVGLDENMEEEPCGAPEVADWTVGLDENMEGPCGGPEVPDSTVGLDENMEGEPNVFVGSSGGPEVPDFSVGSDDEIGKDDLGAAFDELLKAVVECKDKASSFKSILEPLESQLNLIRPILCEIEILDIKLNQNVLEEETKIFIDELKEATKLVRKCSKIQRWNLFKKSSYSAKLKELEDSLEKFFCVYVQALETRDSKKILAKLDEISSNLKDFTVGLDVPLHELKTKLLKDGVQMVLLSAPGGYGKTTLAKMLCHDAEIEGKFKDNIFFVTVSKTPDLKVIAHKMFQHKNFRVPEFRNDDDAIAMLGYLLNEMGTSPKLLVLDDVWAGSESLLQKFMFPLPEYKILVTSRFVFPRFDSTYELELLNDEDAMALFRYSAFRQVGSSDIPDDLVNEIVSRCKGLPLALTLVGGSLRGRPEVIWRHTLKQWCEGQSIFDSNSDLLICLKTSIDAFDENVKECFLDLGSFPEDQRIPVAALMDMWVELYNLDEDVVYAHIYELATRNLVNLVFTRKNSSEFDGYDNEHFVSQHDLLRDFVIYQSSQQSMELRKRLIMDIRGNDFSNWSNEQIQPFHACLMSISTDEAFSSIWYNLQLPEIEVLILNFRTRNYSLPEFMEKMDKLKVLIIANYGFCPAELSNFQLLGLLSSLKRIRLEHVSISFLSQSTLQFMNLQKLSLTLCKIGETFTNCTMEFVYMFPNLVEIDIHCCSDLVELPEGLCAIVCLKKLSITKCNDLVALPQRLGCLTNLELLRLHSCTGLMGLPESVGSLHKLRFLDISDCLFIRELPIQIGELCGLEKLDVRGCLLRQLPPSVNNLGQLQDVICDKDSVYLSELFMAHLNNLNIIMLEEDKNLNWLPNLHH